MTGTESQISTDEALANCLRAPELRIITGSRLYGTARFDPAGNCISDTDLRDVVVPPFEYLTNLRGDFEQRDGVVTDDHIVYSLQFFTKQLLSANPQFLELLFVPDTHIQVITSVGRELLAMKEAFLSKRFYKRLTGFAYSEFRKAQGVKLQFEEHTPPEDRAWDTFRETFGPKWGKNRKIIADEIKALAYSCHATTLVPSTDGISMKRRGEFEQFGYCASSACHSLRLLRQTAELLRTGTMTFPRPDWQELKDIKHGKSTLEAFTKLYEAAKADAEEAYKTTSLPDEPDGPKVSQWLATQQIIAIASDDRFRLAAKQVGKGFLVN